jgi:hypothetical protein
MKPYNELNSRILGFLLLVSAGSTELLAQVPGQKVMEAPKSSSEVWFYVTFGLALVSLGMVLYFWRKSGVSFEKAQSSEGSGTNNFARGKYQRDVETEKEPKWLRKTKSSPSNTATISYSAKKAGFRSIQNAPIERQAPLENANTKAFQDRMKMLQYVQLPINSFTDFAPVKHFAMLPDSNAKALLAAIRQTSDEFENDEAVRESAIKTLASFRTSNSADALTQIALYDISATLRSKATTVLADFDHESVFETVLQACADPTREVRAAAARGLFRLNFDRSVAWKRIIETDDEFRKKQAIRAATEAGIVVKSLDRLVHEDTKIAYEAFTLAALMIKSGETNEIFKALRDHKDERVKYALLHVLKAIKDERSLDGLNDLVADRDCSPEVLRRVQDAVTTLKAIAAHSQAWSFADPC